MNNNLIKTMRSKEKEFLTPLPLWLFSLLSFLTFQLYPVYWYYKCWKFLKEEKGENVHPVWRSILYIIFNFSLFSKLFRLAKENGYTKKVYPLLCAITNLVILYMSSLFPSIFQELLILNLAFIPLLPIVNSFNYYIAKQGHLTANHISKRRIVIMIPGSALWIYCIVLLIKISVLTGNFSAQSIEYKKLADEKNASQDYSGAIMYYDKALDEAPNFVSALINRGHTKSTLGMNESAINDFNKAIILNNTISQAYNNRALAKIRLKLFTSALQDCDTAITLDPNTGHVNKCLALIGLEKFSEVIENVDKAVGLGENDVTLYLVRGIAKISVHDTSGGCLDFQYIKHNGTNEADQFIKIYCK